MSSYRRQEFKPLNYNDHLTLDQVKQSRFKIHHQEIYDSSDLFFIEGGRLLYKYKDRMQKGIKKCIGYGSSLALSPNPINNYDNRDIGISKCIMDTGIIDSMFHDKRDLSIKLISEISLTTEHKIVYLTSDAKLKQVDCNNHPGTSIIKLTNAPSDIVCATIIYKTTILGQFWIKENWLEPLATVCLKDDTQRVREMALFYRCFKAPVLFTTKERKQRGRLRSLLSTYFVDILAMWLSPRESFLLQGFKLDIEPIFEDKAWQVLLSELFWFFDFNRLKLEGLPEDIILNLLEETKHYKHEKEQYAAVFMLLEFISPFFFRWMLVNSYKELDGFLTRISGFIEARLKSHFEHITSDMEVGFDTNKLFYDVYAIIASRYSMSMESSFVEDLVKRTVDLSERLAREGEIFGDFTFSSTQDESSMRILKQNIRYLLKDQEFRDVLTYKLIERLRMPCLN